MKYIRTRDGIQDTQRIFGNVGEYIKDYAIKQADNIEDLIDEYVLVDKVYSVNPDVKDKMLRKCFGKETFKKELIYGAIWTDKGLIYVAKMNEKGELELL